MPIVSDFYEYIDSIAPFSGQMEWDNSGLLTGDENAAVQRVCLALDITPETVRKAAEMEADLRHVRDGYHSAD